MTRARRGSNWRAARLASREAAQRAREAGPPVYVRKAERSDNWLLRYVRFAATCETCGDDVITGERAWMTRDESGWHFKHEACRE